MDVLKSLGRWLAKAKVEVKKHPEDVIDVKPSVLNSMKRRLKKKPKDGPRKPTKDIMDDSVHYSVKKSEDVLNALGDWLEKGVHGFGSRSLGTTPGGFKVMASGKKSGTFKPADHIAASEMHEGEMKKLTKLHYKAKKLGKHELASSLWQRAKHHSFKANEHFQAGSSGSMGEKSGMHRLFSGGVKKSLVDWIAKAQGETGVHKPLARTSGNSAAGQATRSHASAGPTTGRKAKDKARALQEHGKVIGEMRAMKRPNLPKSEADAFDDEDCGVSRSVAKACAMAMMGKKKKKTKLEKDDPPPAPAPQRSIGTTGISSGTVDTGFAGKVSNAFSGAFAGGKKR